MSLPFKKLFDLSGKSAYVPAGYGGIGSAISRVLAAAGAKVVISGRSAEKAQMLADEIQAAGGQASGIACDAHSVAELRDSVDAVVEKYGGIDILVNCVGIMREMPLLDFTEEAYDEVYQVNLKAAMFLGQAAARHQIKSGGGKHVHILSVRSQLALRGRGYSAYVSTKGGQALMLKQHAMELAPHNINVNGVAPTFVATDMTTQMLADEKFKTPLLARIPLGRLATPEDIANATLFFCSPAADFVTGQILYVDGGITSSQ